MAITPTALGTRSIQITTSGTNNTQADFFLKVKNAMIGTSPVMTTGWTLFDEFATGHQYTQVFRAINADAATYKLIILRYNILANEIYTTTAESWNATTHVATNEAYTYFECAPISYMLNNCDLIIFISPRYCILFSYINNEPGLWAGVVEMAREDSNDTSANNYPCWGWTSSTLPLLGCDDVAHRPGGSNADDFLISLPRTRTGLTGAAAARNFSAVYDVVAHPTFQATTSTFLYHIGSVNNKFATNAWNSAGKLAMPIRPIYNYDQVTICNYGTIFGLKICPTIGIAMNKVALTIDADGNYSSAGTSNDHWVLNHNWKASTNVASSWWGNTSITKTAINVGGVQSRAMVSTGSAYYITCSDNTLRKVDIASQVVTIVVPVNSIQYYGDLRFDNERYIYFGHGSGVGRLDTWDDTYVLVTWNQSAVNRIGLSSTHVWICPQSANATQSVSRFLRSATFDSTTVNAGNVSVVIVENVLYSAIECTVDGDAILIQQTSSTAGSARTVKITAAGVVSVLNQFTASVAFGASSIIPLSAQCWVIHIQVSSSTTHAFTFNPRTMTQIGTTSTSNISHAITSGQGRNGWARIGGMIISMVMPTDAGSAVIMRLGTTMVTNVVTRGTLTATTGPSTYTMMWSDGTKIILSSSSGIIIYSNINGPYPQTGTTLGQALIPS